MKRIEKVESFSSLLFKNNISFRFAMPWIIFAGLSPLWLLYPFYLIRSLLKIFLSSGDSYNIYEKSGVGTDFFMFWSAGHIAITHYVRHIYDKNLFSAWQSFHLAKGIPAYLQYIYPPPSILLSLIVAYFNLMSGFLVWTFVLVATGLVLLRLCRAPWAVITLGLAGPAFMFNITIGQLGFVTGAIAIAGLFAIDEHPCSAGALLGGLVVKPQAGLLGPVALLARGRYGGLVVGAIVVACLCATITVICGWVIWPSYFHNGIETADKILIAPFPTIYEEKGISIFWMLRSFGASVQIAEIAQVLSAIGSAIWCWAAWRRQNAHRIALVALTVALTLLVTPYAFTTDMCGFSIMVVWLVWERRRLEVMDVLMWVWPALCPLISTQLHMELTPCILLLGAIRAWQQLGGVSMLAGANNQLLEKGSPLRNS